MQQLLAVAPEALHCLDSAEAGVLHYAAVAEKPDTLKWILEGVGATLNRSAMTRKPKETPLMWAARAARAGNVKLLCEGMSQEDASKMFRSFNAAGLTVMHLAVSTKRAGRLDTVRALIDCGASVDAFADTRLMNKVLPSMIAAQRGDLDMLLLLGELGADLTAADKLGRTLLMFAAMNGHVHVVSHLLRAGVDADAVDSSENTAMHYAAAYGWVECVQLLLPHAKPDQRNSWSTTPLSLALKKGCYACAAVLLQLSDSVDVNVRDNNGRSLFSSLVGSYTSLLVTDPTTPVPWAISQMLQRADLDVSSIDLRKRSVLHYMAESESSKHAHPLIQQLLHRGIDLLLVDEKGWVAAGLALRTRDLELASMLLTHTSHAHLPSSSDGSTLLHLLFEGIGAGEDPGLILRIREILGDSCAGVLDNLGRTPMMVAASAMVKSQQKSSSSAGGGGGDGVEVSDPAKWTRTKSVMEGLVDSMPSHASDTLQRRAEFARWAVVEKRIQTAEGKVNWAWSEEYGSEGVVVSLLHALCALDDVAWALSMCKKVVSAINDQELVRRIINLKSCKGETPVLMLLRKIGGGGGGGEGGGLSASEAAAPAAAAPATRLVPSNKPACRYGARCTRVNPTHFRDSSHPSSHPKVSEYRVDTSPHAETDVGEGRVEEGGQSVRPERMDVIVELLQLLHSLGADMNGIPHPLFNSLDEVQDSDDAMDETLDISYGSEDEKLERVRAFVRNRERAKMRDELSKDDTRKQHTSSFKPYLHILLAFRPPVSALTQLLGTCGLQVKATDLAGKTGLHVAVEGGMEEQSVAMLPFADVNALTLSSDSPLIIAAHRGLEKLVRILVESKAELNYARSGPGSGVASSSSCLFTGTALHSAVRGGHSDVVKCLLKAGCAVDARDDEHRTALHLAVSRSVKSTQQVLKPIEGQLLAAGADVNAKDIHGRTPASYAFVDVATDMKCKFPTKGVCHDPVDMLSMLSSVDGIQFDIADAEGRTLLHLAAAVGASICVLSLTERSPALMHAEDMDMNTPLALALLAGAWDTALLLISKGSALNVSVTSVQRARSKRNKVVEKSRSRQSALWYALRGKASLSTYMLSAKRLPMETSLCALLHTGSFQKALQHIVECPDKQLLRVRSERTGMTALHRLAQAPSFVKAPGFAGAIADALLECGLGVNDVCNRGWSAVHIAAFHGHVGLVNGLIGSRGASVDTRDTSGGTPVSSMFAGAFPTVEMLCDLHDASKDAAAMANSTVQGTRLGKDDAKLTSLLDAEARLFDTPATSRRAKEAFLERLAAASSAGSGQSSREDSPEHTTGDGNEDENNLQSVEGGVEDISTSGDARTVGTAARKDAYVVSSTALIEAVRDTRKCVRMINALLSYGADITAVDQDGRTALHHAVLTQNSEALDRLLLWSRDAIDVVDKAGCSALSYAVLLSLGVSGEASPAWEVLLEYGADPQVGRALELAVWHNQLLCVRAMLKCVRTSAQAAPAAQGATGMAAGKGRSKFKLGDSVWVRFGRGGRASWQTATVVEVNGSLLSVVVDAKRKCESRRHRRWFAVERVPDNCAVAADETVLPSVPAMDVLVQHFKAGDSMSEAERRALLKRREGTESSLMEQLDASSARVQCILSPLSVGDTVGRLVFRDVRDGPSSGSGSSISNTGEKILQVGIVCAIHPNGSVDMQLLGGLLLTGLKRTELRTLSKDMQLRGVTNNNSLGRSLVHECVCPFPFGSYENVDMLRALADAGAPLDAIDASGSTPLELTRPGSEMQTFLRDKTNQPNAGRVEDVSMEGPPALDGIDLAADAKTAMMTLHEQGAGLSERVVPEVNPVCQVDSEGAYVLQDGEEWFDVVLTKVDVLHGPFGKYVFYKMQVVHDPVQKVYILLTNWGRIGEQGKFQQTPFPSREECVAEFCKVFKSKTANTWAARISGLFERKPGKYSLVRTMRTRLQHPEKLLASVVSRSSSHHCSLDTALVDTLRGLLSVDMLTAALKLSGLDQARLPLGYLSMETLDAAEAKLREMKEILDEQPPSDAGVVEKLRRLERVAQLSSEYYELLPIGDKVVKPFTSCKDTRFGEAVELIRTLRDLSVTKELLFGAMHRQAQLDPIEYAYKALQVGMQPLLVGSKERECVQRFVDSTCTSDVLVNQVYSLDTGQGAGGSEVANKRLLFHGSKNFNVLGILKHGLRVAPPEAPTTGYMYGKGVYFSDHFDKAFGYTSRVSSGTSQQQPRAYVFVAEVALGEQYVTTRAEYMEAPPDGTHSTFAPGPTQPDPALNVVLDSTGAAVPMGRVIKSQLPQSALFAWKRQHTTIWTTALRSRKSVRIQTLCSQPRSAYSMRLKTTRWKWRARTTPRQPRGK
mmetsp:Transcript_64090/g.133635  ORF Transcript_64090/g.133635 Transcript_64090/m.133635 type:complete len:2350 (+) Transcript_64090:1066-8115(+)